LNGEGPEEVEPTSDDTKKLGSIKGCASELVLDMQDSALEPEDQISHSKV
jgi:hypothetical protein